ncbi:MAG: TIGR00725 family protein [Candidatus Aenigmarchaeota archaeon]|nr:TIGR00725 family protein [Candidatus Aenigmarchaeota archaeon]
MIKIAVIGNNGEIGEDLSRAAEEIGKEVAIHNCVLLCGGLGGVMKAAAKGAKASRGLTIGIIPNYLEPLANEYIDITISGLDFGLRNNILVQSADCIIAIGGGAGTLNEISMAYLSDKPVIIIKGYGGWVDKLGDDFIDERKIRKLIVAFSPKEAVEKALEAYETAVRA